MGLGHHKSHAARKHDGFGDWDPFGGHSHGHWHGHGGAKGDHHHHGGHHCRPKDCDDQAPQPGTPPAGKVIGTVNDGHGLLMNIYAEEIDGGLKITLDVAQGQADLRGFFMDVGDSVAGVSVEDLCRRDFKIRDEGVVKVGAKDNNMKGTGEKFDVGVEFGTPGKGKDDISQASFKLMGVTLEQLDDLQFGVRATSVGECRNDGVKLVGTFEIPDGGGNGGGGEEGPWTGDDFENWPAENIDFVTFYFDRDQNSTTDELYMVRIANFAPSDDPDVLNWYSNDLDDNARSYNGVNEPMDKAMLSYIIENSDVVTADTKVLGAALTGEGAAPRQAFYEMDANDPAPDAFPAGAAVLAETFDYNDIIPV
jgi:hypothetical protein